MTLLFLAVGGAFGAVSRYLVQGWVQDLYGGRFPWGTFAVNISGSFVLGLVFGIALGTVILPSLSRQHAADSPGAFSATLDWGMRWVFLICVPNLIGLYWLTPVVAERLKAYPWGANDR